MTEIRGIPTTAELIEAVREFLERDVMTLEDGRVAYLARVSANVLGQCERELTHGALQDQEAEAALVREIREGKADARFDEVAADLKTKAIERLRVSNPRYLRPEDQT
jgi:hypothetical protein